MSTFGGKADIARTSRDVRYDAVDGASSEASKCYRVVASVNDLRRYEIHLRLALHKNLAS
jgi:hypothetical protein